MKMNPEIKAKWIEALRSGKYQQTQDVLCDDEGFCCLGVLCEVLVPGAVLEHRHDETSDIKPALGYEPDGLDYDIRETLAHMNDGFGEKVRQHSFAEIADYIEINL